MQKPDETNNQPRADIRPNGHPSPNDPGTLYACVEVRILDKLLKHGTHLYDGGAQGMPKRSLLLEDTIEYIRRQAEQAKQMGGTDAILAMGLQQTINLYVATALWVGGKGRIGDPPLGAKFRILQALHPSRWYRRGNEPKEAVAAKERAPSPNSDGTNA